MVDLIKKTRDDYNKIAKEYAATRPHVWGELLQFKPYLRPGQKILDWGCGHGRLIELLKDVDVEYFGIDQSIKQIQLAKKMFAPLLAKRTAHFFCTAHREKKFSKEFFDVEFMIASFFHLPNEKTRLQLLKKLFSELKPGGHLFITVWNLKSDWAKQKKRGWKQITPNDFFIPWKDKKGAVMVERYYHHFEKNELKELLEKTGFTVESMEYQMSTSRGDGKSGRNIVVIAKK